MTENKFANPAPLGLLGFGMTTILLNLHNAGLIELTAVIAAMGFALGGTAQIVAGIMEYKNRNLFGATAFTSYGFFWWSLIIVWCDPFPIASADNVSTGFYLLLWGVFTLFMAIGSLRHDRATRIVFFSLTVLFFLLSLGDFTGFGAFNTLAGVIGIFCGGAAIYSGFAQILNEEYGKIVMPLGKIKQ